MKKYFYLLLLCLIGQLLSANAILFHEFDLLPMVETEIDVVIDNQVAIVTSTQKFINDTNLGQYVRMGFPIPEDASATQLSWKVNNGWQHASFSATPQDSIIPGPGTNHPYEYQIRQYLGGTPLYFSIPDGIPVNDTISVQFTYVQLLEYDLGVVNFHFPSDYSAVYSVGGAYDVDRVHFRCEINSVRQIDVAYLQDLIPLTSTNDGHQAIIEFEDFDNLMAYDFNIEYALSNDQLGLSSISTMLDDAPDYHGDGFFLFLAEPESDTQQVVRKNLTLIIDKSGSMSGNKIQYARQAANYIAMNLNEQDYFNIITFSDAVSSYQPQHVQATTSNIDDAENYINSIYAGGGTNISAAFGAAVPQFSSFNDSTANLIVFLTDGQATVGITANTSLTTYINGLFEQLTASVRLFAFGVGTSVNTDVLTAISNNNNGYYYNINSSVIEETLSEFYNRIRNPVIINPVMTFSDSTNITETYPKNLMDLYVGQQLVVVGRYHNSVMESVNFAGTAGGADVSYDFNLNFADSSVTQFQFLTKVWAKRKIEYLMTQYYLFNENSQEALEIKDTIIEISISYGVLSPFTSFTDPETGIDEDEEDIEVYKDQDNFVLNGNYPNPFNPETSISFSVKNDFKGLVKIKIYNVKGQLVKTLAVRVDGAGDYSVLWKGTDQRNNKVASGMYMYIIDFGRVQLHSKMLLLK